jgi:hypothetical protein
MGITTLTNLADLKPEIFRPQAQTQLAQYIDFMMFGMVDRFSADAGEFIPIPSFKELTGAVDIIGDGYNPVVGAIGTVKDIGVVRHMGRAFGAEDLAAIVTGTDPNGEISRQISNYFARYGVQASFLSVLKGLFASTGPLYTSNRYSVYADVASTAATYAIMTPEVAALGMAKLGDQMGKIAAWVMHSKVVADLTAAGFVATTTNAVPYGFDGNGIVNLFLGKPIIMSDTTTTTAGTTSTLYRSFGVVPGALALGVQKDLNPEVERNALKKLSYISTDLHAAAHVRGCAYVTATGANPSDTLLETGTSWTLVADSAKFCGVIAIDTN